MMKIYTRRGDQGMTDLYRAGRVSKTDTRVRACGWLDSLSAELGVVRSMLDEGDTWDLLIDVQRDLIQIGAFVSSGGQTDFPVSRVAMFERRIDEIDANLAPLKEFVLPGANPVEAGLHKARTVCRMAEIAVIEAKEALDDDGLTPAITYLNRLSDLLFVLARQEAG